MLFKEIIGQDELKGKLIDTVKQKRISHAQLFLGPEGCGKLAIAIAYAQYINCENKLDDDSCGVCHSCSKFNRLIHPDLHFIFPNATTKKITKEPRSGEFINEFRELLIEKKYYLNLTDWYNRLGIENKQGIINKHDCNDIIDFLRLKSYESEYTIIIIWMVEKLFHSAAPKILKILEEPPEKTLFLLVSEEHENIISTIKSRAQLIKIPKLKDKDIEKALIDNINCPADKARKIAKFSDGNYIEALQIYNQTEEDEIYFFKFRLWMRLCFAINIAELNVFIEDMASTGREKQKKFFHYAMKIMREALNYKYQENYLLKHEGEELTFVEKFSGIVTWKNINSITEEFNKAIFHIERNANPKILLMDLTFTINKLLKQKEGITK